MPVEAYPSIGSAAYVNTSFSQTITGPKIFLSGTASGVPVIIRGAVGQTGDLFQWQTNPGNILGTIRADGRLAVAASGVGQDTSPYGTMGVTRGAETFTPGYIGWTRAGNIAWMSGVASDNSLVLGVASSSNGGEIVSSNSFLSISASGGTIIKPNNAGAVPLTLKGFTGQTADLQQWWRADGSTGAVVRSDGTMFIGGGTDPNGALAVNSVANAAKVLVLRGSAAQTANLTEWQNSAGTALGFYSSGGNIATAGYVQAGGTGSAAAYIGDPSGTYNSYVKTTSNSQIGLMIKGSASQTGNLIETQNSTGTVLSGMGYNGRLFFNAYDTGVSPGAYQGSIDVTVAGVVRKLPIYA